MPKMSDSLIPNNLLKTRQRITQACHQAERPSDSVQLLAVSKTRPAADLRCAYEAGQLAFGENYLQEALDKQDELSDLNIQWHFIGPIQSNKTRAISENFDWVHSVDRVKIARRLSEQRPQNLPPLNICLQINLDNEDSKSGINLAELPALAASLAELPGIQVRGLMAIPAKRENPEEQRQVFAKLCDALNALRRQTNNPLLDTLSMGMSGDMEAAIAAGATIVRIGTDIFGARQAI
jgi:PLP dependent protein